MTEPLALEVAAPRHTPRGSLTSKPSWITSNQRSVRLSVAHRTSQWRAATTAALEALPYRPEPFQRRVFITAYIFKPTANRYDPGNWYPTAKACIDAIVAAGVLADDDWKHVRGPLMDHGGKCERGHESIIITIEEIP